MTATQSAVPPHAGVSNGIDKVASGSRERLRVGNDDPVITTAPLAHRAARVLCRGERGSAEDCSWYHGFWQYLRVFDLAATPYRHGEFFDAVLAALAGDGAYRRVLVSGAADYAMLAVVLQAYRGVDADHEIGVVDLCETPLFLCRWYADSVAAAVETHVSDVLDWKSAKPFDVVCTHSFLSRFPPARRNDLMSKWRELLRPGGRIVTTTRINPSWSPDSASFTRDQIRAFKERVFQEALKWRAILDVDPDEMSSRAEVHAERTMTHSLTSEDEVAGLFRSGGFTVDRLDLIERSGNLDSRQSGPGTHQNATYAEIVAVRV